VALHKTAPFLKEKATVVFPPSEKQKIINPAVPSAISSSSREVFEKTPAFKPGSKPPSETKFYEVPITTDTSTSPFSSIFSFSSDLQNVPLESHKSPKSPLSIESPRSRVISPDISAISAPSQKPSNTPSIASQKVTTIPKEVKAEALKVSAASKNPGEAKKVGIAPKGKNPAIEPEINRAQVEGDLAQQGLVGQNPQVERMILRLRTRPDPTLSDRSPRNTKKKKGQRKIAPPGSKRQRLIAPPPAIP
jgi:hypothetical protein